MFDDPDPHTCSAWERFAFGELDVVAHRSSVTTLSSAGVRTGTRHDWFAARRATDRWVVFHRSEHLDPQTARTALVAGHRDLDWQAQLLGRSAAELAAAPIVVADLQRAAIAGLGREAPRLRAAEPDERAEIAGLTPAPLERAPTPEELPPLEEALPADPAAAAIALGQVLPVHVARALHRHGLATLLEVSRLSAPALARLPGLDEPMRRQVLGALRRHGLLLAPERSEVADLQARRDDRRRQAARFGELLARGYDVEQIAAFAGRSVGYVRLVLGDRVA